MMNARGGQGRAEGFCLFFLCVRECESLSCFGEEWGEGVGGATFKQIKLGAVGLGQPTP